MTTTLNRMTVGMPHCHLGGKVCKKNKHGREGGVGGIDDVESSGPS